MKRMIKKQAQWCAHYEQQTGFAPMMDDFLIGTITFREAAKKNVRWFEDWSIDTLHAVEEIP